MSASAAASAEDDNEKIALEPAEDEEEKEEVNDGAHEPDDQNDDSIDHEKNGDENNISHEIKPDAHGFDDSKPIAPNPAPLSALRPTLRGTFDVSTGIWTGEWAMSDDDYERSVRGHFEYRKTSAVPDPDTSKPAAVEGQPPDMFVSGVFKLQSLANPAHYEDVREQDILMRFAAADGKIIVQGAGKNKIGAFSLTGTFDPATLALNVYRAYQSRPLDSKSKKKGAPITPGITPKRSSRATPRQPMVTQNWDAAAAAGPAGAVNQRARRPPAHVIELGEEEGRVKSRMLFLVDTLLSLDRGRFFHQPVDPVRDGVPHYLDIIKDPMDLGTVKKKLLSGEYQSEEQVAGDIHLTFSNAMIFNPVDNIVYGAAKSLLDKFEAEYPKVLARREADRERKRKNSDGAMGSKSNGKKGKLSRSASMRSDDSHFSDDDSFASASRTSSKKGRITDGSTGDNEELRLLRKQVEMMSKQLESLQQVTIQSHLTRQHSQQSYASADAAYVAPAPKRPRPTPKPKPQPAASSAGSGYSELDDEMGEPRAAPKTERPLSYQEKRALGEDINKLPADKVQRVLDIIAENSGNQMLGEGAEEVEIDIEKLNTPTLKALQKYVREVLRTEKKKVISGQGTM